MRIDYRDKFQPPPPYGKVIDLDTGQEISHCFLFDTQTGEWGRYLLNAEGRPYYDPASGEMSKEFGQGRITFIVREG